jgi:TPR repeat protein
MLGQKYAHGDGVDQSYQQARKLYELAASQGVDRNDERAAQYLELAADQGMAAERKAAARVHAKAEQAEKTRQMEAKPKDYICVFKHY